jgi:hypothetical protein
LMGAGIKVIVTVLPVCKPTPVSAIAAFIVVCFIK